MDKLSILNRIKEYKKFNSDLELATFLGITRQSLSNWKSRNSIDYDIVFSKCEELNLLWLLTGKGEIQLSEEENVILDIENIRMLREIKGLNQEDQERILITIGALIKDAKSRK